MKHRTLQAAAIAMATYCEQLARGGNGAISEAIAANPSSHTGRFLAPLLKGARAAHGRRKMVS